MSTTPLTVWGTVSKDGIKQSGNGFSVRPQGDGEYQIRFAKLFTAVPAIVGSQTNFGKIDEANTDGVVFPFVYQGEATVITGNANGRHEPRSFSFTAVGHDGGPNPNFKEIDSDSLMSTRASEESSRCPSLHSTIP